MHSIKGMPPSLIQLPRGCKFGPRCPHRFERCDDEPELVARTDRREHLDRCWLDLATKRRVRESTIHGATAAA